MKNSPRRLLFSLGFATLIVALILQFANREEKPEEPSPPQISQPPSTKEEPIKTAHIPVLGDQLLAQYGNPQGSLEADMKLLSRYLSNVFLLVKQRDPRHYSTNEDLAEFLSGRRGQQEALLSPDSRLLNEQGQLVDRLGSPLIIHPLSKDQLEIRSAGPDRIPYTEDDLID